MSIASTLHDHAQALLCCFVRIGAVLPEVLHALPTLHPQSHRPTEIAGPRSIAQGDECGILLARQLPEPHSSGAPQHGRAIEHHERKGSGAQEHVGTPGSASTFGERRTHHPQPRPVSLDELPPVARGEGARGIDHGHPSPIGERASNDALRECGDPTAGLPHDLGESPTRDAPLQYRIELREPGGPWRTTGLATSHHIGDVRPQRSERIGSDRQMGRRSGERTESRHAGRLVWCGRIVRQTAKRNDAHPGTPVLVLRMGRWRPPRSSQSASANCSGQGAATTSSGPSLDPSNGEGSRRRVVNPYRAQSAFMYADSPTR
jgi:hypothetical protein